jgi:flagellar L-ring protein precursor FlgH
VTASVPVAQPEPRTTAISGSLWTAGSVGLADDFKARRLGDILTVVIDEQASASKEAATATGRGSQLSAGIPKLLGLETGRAATWMDVSKLLSASTDTSYTGSGSTSRKENLSATMTAQVVRVQANGSLLIEGRRNVTVNNEDQIIVLEGTVRPRDISADNIVNSALIADARISYSGKGVVSDRQSPGWLMNVVDVVWPF